MELNACIPFGFFSEARAPLPVSELVELTELRKFDLELEGGARRAAGERDQQTRVQTGVPGVLQLRLMKAIALSRSTG